MSFDNRHYTKGAWILLFCLVIKSNINWSLDYRVLWFLALCCLKETLALKIFCILSSPIYWFYCAAVSLNQFVYVLSHMRPQRISRPESFVAEVAGDDNSFKVICFNVIFYVRTMAFLSTDFANKGWLTPIANFVLTFLHHRFHPFFKFFKIPRKVTRNG